MLDTNGRSPKDHGASSGRCGKAHLGATRALLKAGVNARSSHVLDRRTLSPPIEASPRSRVVAATELLRSKANPHLNQANSWRGQFLVPFHVAAQSTRPSEVVCTLVSRRGIKDCGVDITYQVSFQQPAGRRYRHRVHARRRGPACSPDERRFCQKYLVACYFQWRTYRGDC